MIKIGDEVLVTKPSGTKLRGILVWTRKDGYSGVEMCTGFVEYVSEECKIEYDGDEKVPF